MKHFATSIVSAVAVAASAGLAYAAGDPGGAGVAVPLPGSLLLLVTGAIGLAAAGWWMRR